MSTIICIVNVLFFFLWKKNQIQIEEAIVKSRNEQLEKLAAECDVNMEDLNGTVQPIIDSCTKDAILVKYCCSPFSALPFFSPISSVWSDSSILLCHLALIVLDRRFLLKELTRKFKLLSMGRDLARGQCWRSNVWIEITAFWWIIRFAEHRHVSGKRIVSG